MYYLPCYAVDKNQNNRSVRTGFKGEGLGARAPGLPLTGGLPPNPYYYFFR